MNAIPEGFLAALGGPAADMLVIYDGRCPFCTSYVQLVRLREAVGTVKLLNAREDGVAEAVWNALGLDLNEGMLVIYGGRAYYGAEAMSLLSSLTSRAGLANRAIAAIFRSPAAARALYPVLRAGRAAALRLLGRDAIALPDGR